MFLPIPPLRRFINSVIIFSVFLVNSTIALSHESKGKVTYLANEGLMAEAGNYKILFDPFFHNGFGFYQLVPETILDAIKSNVAPYNNIDAIFISHAHSDHFAAQDMLNYLQTYKNVKLIAPDQALEQMALLTGFEQIQNQVTGVSLEYGDTPITFTVDKLNIDAVRIPHSGWPSRAEVSNIVFRVTILNDKNPSTYVHMRDADPKDVHFRPHAEFWQLMEPDFAFPPYWFFLSLQGNYILDTHINATKNIGVHVPLEIPKNLKKSGKIFFHVPGETAHIDHKHE